MLVKYRDNDVVFLCSKDQYGWDLIVQSLLSTKKKKKTQAEKEKHRPFYNRLIPAAVTSPCNIHRY